MNGFVPLCHAADAIGCEMYGRTWRPMKELGNERIPSNEELIDAGYLQRPPTDDDPAYLASIAPMRERFSSNRRAEIILGRTDLAIERVIRWFAERAETGEIETWCRSIIGVDALDCSVWRASNWRSYFVDGEIERNLPLLDDNNRPVGDGRTARCRHEIFVRQRDVDRLIETLPPPPLQIHTKLRYASDKPLIQGALQALKRGEVGNPLQAAKLVYKRADGPTAYANLDRLRKLIGDEWKALTSA
jgi:hypothetical protein